MATEFTTTVKSSGGDYTSLSAAESGLQNDLTLSTIKVFSISAYSTPTITAGDTVLGQASSATGVCVLVNATRTQILIKTIAVASFQSGEVVQKTADANVNVTLSSTGDSPIVGIACYSMSDTTAVTIDGSTTNATNYMNIYTPTSERHDGKWNTGKYNLTVSTARALGLSDGYIRVDGLQISVSGNAFYYAIQGTVGDCLVTSCICRATADVQYLIVNSTGNFTMRNTLVYDSTRYGISLQSAGTQTLQNVTVANCPRNGIQRTAGTAVVTNCLSHNNGDGVTYFDFLGTLTATYCASKDASADDNGGAGNRINQTFTFVDATNKDFHLASSDAGAKDYGTDLSGSFTIDIDGQTRSGSWDIGADEYIAVGGLSIPIAMYHYQHHIGSGV